MRLQSVIALLLFAAAAGIYLWGHLRRRARRRRSARRFAAALLNRYGADAQARASQQLERAVTRRERGFRRAVLDALASPGGSAAALTARVSRPEGDEAGGPKAVATDADLPPDDHRRRRFSRGDLYFHAAVALAAAGAIVLIVYG